MPVIRNDRKSRVSVSYLYNYDGGAYVVCLDGVVITGPIFDEREAMTAFHEIRQEVEAHSA